VTASRPSIARGSAWDAISSGVGYHLDNLGRWLLVNVPVLGNAYAAMLAPGRPPLAKRPGWRFAEEYYDERRWLACRRGALWEAAAQFKLTVPLTLPWLEGTTVELTLGNDNSLCLYVCGSFEPNEFALLSQVLAPGMVFIDAGANDGYYTLFASRRVGASGKVVAIEPSTRERVHLRRNIARNKLDNVTVVAVALGACRQVAALRLAHGVHAGHNTFGSFAHEGVQADNLEQVDVETLDKAATDLGLDRIDFVKIDVEGAEASVIDGARHVLSTMRPTILLEINDTALRAQRSNAESLLSTLRTEFKYDVLVFSPVTGKIEWLADGVPLSANVVAVPAERTAGLLASVNLEA
jgi:FkbM family methyltransferase